MTNNPDGLSDARAVERARRFLDRHTLGFVLANDERQEIARIMAALATPPASDAAVPAGEEDRLTRIVAECFSGMPERMAQEPVRCGVHHIGTLWSVSGEISRKVLAAAPKVASDTGAGLRHSAAKYALICDKLADQTPVSGEPDDLWWERQSALREAGVLLSRFAGAATPTDATDGATGGGEVEPILQRLGRLSDEERASIGRIMSGEADEDQLRRGDVFEAIRSLRTNPVPSREYQKALGDVSRLISRLATTPGGGLLEQAARDEALAIQRRWKKACARHNTLLAEHGALDQRVKRAGERCSALYLSLSDAAIRALNTAGKGEGGE